MRQVTTDGGDHFIPFWRPDHHEVAFYAAHRRVDGVHAVDVTTGRKRLIFRIAGLSLPDSASLHLFRLAAGVLEPHATPLKTKAGGGSRHAARRCGT